MLLEKTAKHTQMQILVYQVSTSLLELSASVVERIRRRHADRQPNFTSLGSNPGPRNYDFSPFPPLFSFFCHIQTFFYTNMNIFITLLENVNKSRTSANNLSLNVYMKNCIVQLKLRPLVNLCYVTIIMSKIVNCRSCYLQNFRNSARPIIIRSNPTF
jgi:hypothetical protein